MQHLVQKQKPGIGRAALGEKCVIMIKIKIIENKENNMNKSASEKNDKETLERISDDHVGYMEINKKASGFCCHDCKGLNIKGFCENPDVQAYVSAEYGCCNYFNPKKDLIVFPKK